MTGVLFGAIPFLLFFLFAGGIWLMLVAWVPAGLHLLRGASTRATRWIDKRPILATRRVALSRRMNPWFAYLPVSVILVCGLGITIVAGGELLDLVEALQSNSPKMAEVDSAVHAWSRETRNASLTRFFLIITLIGNPAGLGIIAFVVSIVLFAGHRYRWILYLWVTTLGAGILNLTLKSHFARERPSLTEALRSAHGYSFPSGHAMGSIAVAGALAYLSLRGFKTWRTQAAFLALCITFFLTVCLSRIYLGVHWISDIAAGLLAGGLWVTTTTLAYETFRRIRAALESRKQ